MSRSHSSSGPTDPAAWSREFADLFAHERRLILEARHLQAIRKRWALVVLCVVLAALATVFGILTVPLWLLGGLAVATAVANALAGFMQRRGRFSPWHFWASLALDSAVLGGFTAVLGSHGYLILPFLVFAIGGYALGLPRAARLQLVLAALVYPAGRIVGTVWTGAAAPFALIGIETLVLVGSALLAMAGPLATTTRLRRARAAMARLEEGDFTTRLPEHHLDDLGFLSVSVNSMSRTIGGVVQQIQEQALSLSAVADELAATAEQVHASAARVGGTTRQVAEQARRQHDLASAGCSAVDRVVADSRALLHGAVASAGDATRVTEDADRQRAQVDRAGHLLVEIGDEVRRSAESVELLERAGDRIEGFVDAIQQIARQTHLLALNASIEAARAGEHGRGFTVVAEEVGKLASRAGGSARAVATVVQELQGAIGEVRDRLRAGRSRIDDVVDVAGGSQVALGSIVAGLAQTTRFIQQIAGDADRQTAAMGELQGEMTQIQSIAEGAMSRAAETAAASEQQIASMESLAASGQELADLAVRLNQLAGRFRTTSLEAGQGLEPALY